MSYFYSAERNVQIVLYLLKTFNIKRVIASPGATNLAIVASMQQDPFFEMYSCVDERSAAYMAVGLAEESGEPVVLSCTGATAARNYMPALTEAYYRKIPIIAITSTRDKSLTGHLIAQVTDRTQQPKDIFFNSVYIQNIRCSTDEWDCTVKLNKILQSIRPIPGPIHINLATGMGGGYKVQELPQAKVISKYLPTDHFPEIDQSGNVAVFIGSHVSFTEDATKAIDTFCDKYNAVVFCDHTSSYKGRFRVMYALMAAQDNNCYQIGHIRTLIHIGEISGDYDTLRGLKVDNVWRVNQDGNFSDTFMGKLNKVFVMNEMTFFNIYSERRNKSNNSYLLSCKSVYNTLLKNIPSFPLSNIYVASRLCKLIPENSVLYLGILNTLRSWNYFEVSEKVRTICNVGGFGIDGIVSSLVGASLFNQDKLYFGIVGDLSFFYDINSIGNRHISNNLRLLIINNGHGQEFEMYNHGAAFLGKDVNQFVAAGGHFGNKSKNLVKHFAEDLSFQYLSASTIDEFNSNVEKFIQQTLVKSIVFEVFTNEKDENEALRRIRNIDSNMNVVVKRKVKKIIKDISSLGE